MSNVVKFVTRDKTKENDALEEDLNSHIYVLDACDEVFEWGAVVLSLDKDGSVGFSSSIEDEEVVVNMLIAAAMSIQKELDKENPNE